MLKIAIMIEGQNGLNWSNWKKLALAVDELGFSGLYRSDHFTNANPPDKDSLELWVSLTWLASNTKNIEFGPLVTPLSFRDPALTARMAASVDDLSEGRFILGLGAGWQEREHNNFGFDLLEIPQRFQRFEEGIQVIQQLLVSDMPVDFNGTYFNLKEAILLPRPHRPGGPPLLIGGNGKKRTLPLVAKYGQEWNALFLPLDEYRDLNSHLDELLIKVGRDPANVVRSLMTGCIIGKSQTDLEQKVSDRTNGKRTIDELRKRGLIIGTPSEILEQFNALSSAGLEKIMLQWLQLDDIEGLELIAREFLI